MRALLITGPVGVGKTTTAEAIAGAGHSARRWGDANSAAWPSTTAAVGAELVMGGP